MIEQQLRDGLRAAVADEPPLGFDPDRVAEDARRAVRRRRAVVASAGATVLVVGVIVGTASVAGSPEGRGPAGPASSAVPTPPPTNVPTTTPPARPARDPLGLGPKAERIGAHVSRVLPEVVPGARNAAAFNFGQEAIGDYSLGNWLNFIVSYDDNGGRAFLAVEIFGAGHETRIPSCERVPPDRCAPVTQPDGSTVFFHESADRDAPGRRGRTAYHEHGGATVMVSTYTYDGFSPNRSPAVRDSFPLTDDQLIRLVTDPALSLSP